MAELKVYLSEELDKRFRMLAMSIFGYGRGSLSEAAVEALRSWCQQQESRNGSMQTMHTQSPESDPAARAEERPMLSPTMGKASGSVVDEDGTDENAAPGSNRKDRN